jgi:uncharacterized oligopeptide transporter (OPT) family protein
LLSFNIAIPIYHAYFLAQNPELAATVAARCQGISSAECAEVSAQILRGAQIRYLGVGAMLVGGLWALITLRGFHRLGRQERSRCGARRQRRPDRAHGTRSADEVGAARHRVVHRSACLPVLQHRRQRRHRPRDVGHHGGRRISVLLGVGVHGGPRRLSNNPVSGITIATILFAALVLVGFLGKSSTIGRWRP